MNFEILSNEEVESFNDHFYAPIPPNKCECGRFKKVGGRCSLEIKVYRYGSFAGWEHY